MNEITEYLETEMPPHVALEIATLACRSFPKTKSTPQQRVEEMLSAAGSRDPEKTSGRRFVIWQDGQAVAHSRIFIRIVRAGKIEVPVLALASVCTDQSVRGRGLGVQVTQRAFEQIGQPTWPEVSLFQTPVAEFYKKLNCRVVTNRFVNRRNADDPQGNPWRDDTVMIYPAEFIWPAGIIDLNGPDY